jgi:hypothetical protein
VATSRGIVRSQEPSSAGPFASSGTLAYGAWLADLDGDARLDYYGVNHGQTPHRSGMWKYRYRVRQESVHGRAEAVAGELSEHGKLQ